MSRPRHLGRWIPPEYCGTILHGDYSDELKTRVAECIRRYRDLEETHTPVLLYIAGWQEQRRKIWYEYVGRQFTALLGCEAADVAGVFRNAVIDRRIYRYMDEGGVHEEIESGEEVSAAWKELRKEGRQSGTIEAVYKILLPRGGAIWLKDLARIETYEADKVCLSLGTLTPVSKEMEAEDELKDHRDLLETTVQARTADLLQLNAQLGREVVERKQAEKRLQVSCDRLRRNLNEIVTAMALMVEERDPYTAGHQKRATGLAVALAREMNLCEDTVRGIEMAGLMHDIGKLSIPAEILSKPGQLNEAEIQIIKRHPQVAYDILKRIDFQRPVDLIVLHHHERMDRSGYPQGLGGEEILMEARILCVADVVESMASHRPYRPALGLQKAQEEILRNRGILYDPEVVDACIEILRKEKNAVPADSHWFSMSGRAAV